VALALWALLTRRVRGLIGCFCLALIILLTVSAAGVTIPGAASRGGAVNVSEIAARGIAPFNADLAEKLSPHAQQYAGTTEWRRKWWGYIWAGVNESEERQLVGYGYGFPLSDLFPQLSEELVRTPHNIFFFTLGYSGWIGVGVFTSLQLALLVWLARAYRVTRSPFGLMVWVIALCSGMFGNFYETPYNSVPYFVLLGMALAPLAGDLADAARLAAAPGRRDVPAYEGRSA
jgi:hypothetical protein